MIDFIYSFVLSKNSKWKTIKHSSLRLFFFLQKSKNFVRLEFSKLAPRMSIIADIFLVWIFMMLLEILARDRGSLQFLFHFSSIANIFQEKMKIHGIAESLLKFGAACGEV